MTAVPLTGAFVFLLSRMRALARENEWRALLCGMTGMPPPESRGGVLSPEIFPAADEGIRVFGVKSGGKGKGGEVKARPLFYFIFYFIFFALAHVANRVKCCLNMQKLGKYKVVGRGGTGGCEEQRPLLWLSF